MDNELKQKIRLDVQRTFQERPLFLLQEIQEMMVSILFTWSKCNAEISYKQGMNELLGILIFVGYADMPQSFSGISSRTAEILGVINSREHLEADIYWCFARVMDLGISELFNPVVSHQGKVQKKQDLFTWDAEKQRNDLVNQDKSKELNVSSILRRCHKVHHQLLQGIDRELFGYIEAKQVEPQMYLQRWLRCMLSREFNLADTLELWDAIFAVYSLEPEKEFMLLDYLCIAMIVFVRAFCKSYAVMQADQSGILRRLLKFPPVEDVHILVGMALKYKNREISGRGGSKVEKVAMPAPTPFAPAKKIMEEKAPLRILEKTGEIEVLIDEAIGIVSEIVNE